MDHRDREKAPYRCIDADSVKQLERLVLSAHLLFSESDEALGLSQ